MSEEELNGAKRTGKSQELDPRFFAGVELFNKEEFFDCHEILEECWKEEKEPQRQLTQGIIQVAVAYYHALRGNKTGAVKLLRRGIPRISPFLPEKHGLDLAAFMTGLEKDLAELESSQGACKLLLPKLARVKS